MPKKSKAVKLSAYTSTKPGDPPREKDKLDKYVCTRCGKIYVRQKSNFPASQSPLYKDSGYLPVCNHCIDNLYDHYKEALGSGEAAIERICMKFDIYWNPDLYGMINKINTSASRVKSYISKTFLLKYLGKTYDDTLDESAVRVMPLQTQDGEGDDLHTHEMVGLPANVSADSVIFWGTGFDAEAYRELDMRFDRWTRDLPKPLPIVEESLYKQICLLEMQINRNLAAGKDVEKGQNALNTLLGSLNVKPSQKRDDDNAEFETTPLGVWAKRWEDMRPIPEYKEDINKPSLIKYITTWFYGHTAKALGIKNIYSQVYEDEIEKYRVKKPEFNDENDDIIISDIVSGSDDA